MCASLKPESDPSLANRSHSKSPGSGSPVVPLPGPSNPQSPAGRLTDGVPARRCEEVITVHTLKRWWLDNWDTLVLVALVLSIALAIGGILDATLHPERVTVP